jgi:hypothetical protein
LALIGVSALAAEPVDYLRSIKPIFKERCFACHAALKQEAGLRLDTGANIRKGSENGPVLVPGKSADSALIERVSSSDLSVRMPPEGKALTAEQIAALSGWIDQGAASPQQESPEEDPREHWAFRKPVRPAISLLNDSSGLRREARENGIDVLLATSHAKTGVQPRPAAEKNILLRRVYLDLIGLPPTREELQAFLADESPEAYERVVERLLDDPRHGERWARHWMDVWRYSDWYGRRYVPDVWNSAPQMWRWRDWIVRSLNDDHGYDRMVREMLAADETCPEDGEAIVATGYLVRNWYALNPNDWMRNTVEHTGKAFLGLTFNCAHCHDHKYDPIAQTDYFKLRAFFEPINVRQDRVAGEADPGPFQEYSYSVLRKIQRLGSVSVFDKAPEAPTWFYTGGDERNRLTDRGSIPPGLPAFLSSPPLKIEPVTLPPRGWYPGLRPEIQETVLAELRQAIIACEPEVAAARKELEETPAAAKEQLAQAQAAFDAATKAAAEAGTPGALSGKQSLLLQATVGRRALQNRLQGLKSLDDGSIVQFELQIVSDAHVNFQLAQDVAKGATATYVGFDKGRILTYLPGSFVDHEAARYDLAAGQKRFQVSLVLQTKEDRCLLRVRSIPDGKQLVEALPIGLNGWNPVGDPLKGLTFDARPGSVAVVDNVTLTTPTGDKVFSSDFEAPTYMDGQDCVGTGGWEASPFGTAPATSVVSTTATNEMLRDLASKVAAAKQALLGPTLRLQAAEARLTAAQAELHAAEVRIAADRARYGEAPGVDTPALIKQASQLERDAQVKKTEAEMISAEAAVAIATAKSTTDANRAKELEAANARLTAARPAVEKSRAALSDPALAEQYTPLTPQYPRTSTGRRKALAEWITSRDNPLTARVAVNHIWLRHFHAPLVSSMYDFGRNGARPTHPELLDYLAVELMESGWSMKHLHRLIVTSQAYRRASSVGDAKHEAAVDPENKLLWRMNAGRMEAEVVRDSLLYAAGRLEMKMGGQELENNEALKTFRRSLYYATYPEEGGKSDFGVLFDGPEALECYRRTRSVVPQQALALTNSELVHELSAGLAESVWNETTVDVNRSSAFIAAAFERILSRAPSGAEATACAAFLAKQAGPMPTPEREMAARESLVRALLNHNDFVTIR